jgi:peptide/nickel transport system permease protein/oligopeptide transport system permease protein
LRNSLIPVVTYLGIDLGALMGGAIITEGIFNLPGIGQQVFLSIRAQEGPVVVGIVTALVLVFIVANLVVDLLYAVLDPRIRYE